MLTPANYQRPKGAPPFRLLISDMDSTVIGQECIDELADCVGLKPQVAAITEAAMRGELDFKAALIERVALLKGLPVSELDRVYAERITLSPGIQQLVQTANQHGLTTVLVSGGFTFFTQKVAAAAGFQHQHGNNLGIENGTLTGKVEGAILDKDAKLAYLNHYCTTGNHPPEAALALGDGANDLPMLLAAGLGVAYQAKPLVAAACPLQLTGDFNALAKFIKV